MITTTAGVLKAVHSRTIEKSRIVAWLNVQVSDASAGVKKKGLERYQPRLSSVAWRAGWLPEGWKAQKASLTLLNVDGELDPWNSAGLFGAAHDTDQSKSFLNGKAEITVEQYIRGADGQFAALPVFVGVVVGLDWSEDLSEVRLTLQDRLSRALQIASSENFSFDRSFSLFDNGQVFLRDQGGWDSTKLNSTRRNYLESVMSSLEWYGMGSIPEGTSVLNAYNAIMRSCAVSPFMTEAGNLDWVSEWPDNLNGLNDSTGELGTAITADFVVFTGISRSEAHVTDLNQTYQNVSVRQDLGKDPDDYANPGVLNYAMPYIQTIRQAETVRKLLTDVCENTLEILGFRSVGLGLLLQLGDIVRIDYGGREQEWRVTAKRWTEDYVDIECVPYHQAGNKVETYTHWGNNWGTAVLL